MQDVARLHRLGRDSRKRSVSGLQSMLLEHVCTLACPSTVAVFEFIDDGLHTIGSDGESFCDQSLLCRFPILRGQLSRPGNDKYVFTGIVDCGIGTPPVDADSVVVEMPLTDLLRRLDFRCLAIVADAHRIIPSGGNWMLDELVQELVAHQCWLCSRSFPLFRRCGLSAESAPLRLHSTSDAPLPSSDTSSVSFPPLPLNVDAKLSILRDWSDSIDVSAVYEKPCAICARMCIGREVVSIAMDRIDLSPLHRDGEFITRTERVAQSDAVYASAGPVLLADAIHVVNGVRYMDVCESCRSTVQERKSLPRFALANGLWLGHVPRVLRELTFVEQMLVARVRHNSFVVKVTKGQRKMIANAIAFSQSVEKIYDVLPPPREELDEVLAILFTGPCRPSEEDFKRTPLLVRHRVVLAALQWLALNHCDYGGVTISLDNLYQYPEHQPPVTVLRRVSDGFTPAEAMSVHDIDEGQGTSDGPCAFVVHGLSAADVATMSYKARIATALQYFHGGGAVLGYGHSAKPESIYHNYNLLPGMFPWLFPYGVGGIENLLIKTRIDRGAHIRYLLSYVDRRFQTDYYFPFVVFNQQQIRDSTRGGYLLTKRQNFRQVTDLVSSVKVDVLQRLIDRGKDGSYLRPENPDEERCFELISVLDCVAGHVEGSSAKRKQLRKEIQSLIIAHNVPLFFITFSPVDISHPLCLYYCGESIDIFESVSSYPPYAERLRMIADNPVACARFFDFMVNSFVTNILRIGSNKDGLFGRVRAYYGTVEAQGRLTLHMHMLLWIMNSLSPLEIRSRVLADDSFRRSILEWLDGCQQGDYSTGTSNDVMLRVESHSTGLDSDNSERCLPSTISHLQPANTSSTVEANDAYARVIADADEVVYSSNRHRCRLQTSFLKGCRRTAQSACRARFPHELCDETGIDISTGAIHFKKSEPWINTFNPVLSYALRCNTDVTSLLSETQVRAVIAYITDYITKSPLKTYSIFESVHMVLDRNSEAMTHATSNEDLARSVVSKVVNALSAKMEIGAPMVCAYLLGFPDHYTNVCFKQFYWAPYVKYVAVTSQTALSVSRTVERNSDHENVAMDNDHVVIGQAGSEIVPLNKLNDYIYRPSMYERFCLYDYLARSDIVRQRCSDSIRDRNSERSTAIIADVMNDEEVGIDVGQRSTFAHRLMTEHPLHNAHIVADVAPENEYVLNFLGKALPRRDKGDRESYCQTMLMFFFPNSWRMGADIKPPLESWDDVFRRTVFAPRHIDIMANMNVLYECRDARDDFAVQRVANESLTSGVGFVTSLGLNSRDVGNNDPGALSDVTQEHLVDLLCDQLACLGDITSRNTALMAEMRTLMRQLRTIKSMCTLSDSVLPVPASVPLKSSAVWKAALLSAKNAVIAQRVAAVHTECDVCSVSDAGYSTYFTPDDVRVLTVNPDVSRFYDTKRIPSSIADGTLSLMNEIMQAFTLNEEQQQMFCTCARHLYHHDKEPLQMYLGGIGGTGKSLCIRAVSTFLMRRGEASRFLLMAPTGSAACLISGSTYHSILGFSHSSDHVGNCNPTALSKVRERLAGVDVIFIDEVSMISCFELYRISAQMSKALGVTNQSFGGVSVILSGDFAQLPPAGRNAASLYSNKVRAWSSAATLASQQSAIGKALWHQFTTVIILQKNMGQTGLTDEDVRFRVALNNMRYKACTSEDIALLSTRVITGSDYPLSQCLADPAYRDVSIITGLNAQRDAINEICAHRFASDNNLTLTWLYSLDSWSSLPQTESVRYTQRTLDSACDPTRSSNNVVREIQDVLWSLPPNLTGHRAGILSLCPGMPVMLKTNEATELCATNGAESYVYSWDSHHDGSGHEILDTLFVRLKFPPQTVQIEGLPPNVIPLPRTRTHVKCTLPNDAFVYINRDQVNVLHNFAMTDYCSQGRTRPINVCHLKYCRGHQSIYTVLSRSASLSGTLILDGFDVSKLKGGLSGDLQCEFRELEILDEIHRLQFHQRLPPVITECTRASLIRSFQAVFGPRYTPPNVDTAIRWQDSPIASLLPPAEPLSWRLAEKTPHNETLPVHSSANTVESCAAASTACGVKRPAENDDVSQSSSKQSVTVVLDKRSKRLKRDSHVECAALIPLIPIIPLIPSVA